MTDPAKRQLPENLFRDTSQKSFLRLVSSGSCLVQPEFEMCKARRRGWSLWHEKRTFAAIVGQSTRHGTFLADGSRVGKSRDSRCCGGRHHAGKTQLWNRAGEEPPGPSISPSMHVWPTPPLLCGREVKMLQGSRGIRILGTPLGHSDYVVAQLQETIESHRTLLERIPALTDLQSAWLLLLFYGTSRANYSLRVVHPCLTESFARQHDSGAWQCLCTLLDHIPDNMQRNVGSLP